MVNFTLPNLEEDAEENAIEKKVQEWTFKKMAEQFKNWKKRLVVLFVNNKTKQMLWDRLMVNFTLPDL